MRRSAAVAVALVLSLPAGLLPPAPASALAQPLAATIFRDDFGVAHVFADDLYALVYANGYVQAQDRLFEMDVLRHVGRGNAASVLGESVLAMDIAARRDLYSEEQREARFQAAGPPIRLLLKAYSDGVNRAIAEMAAQGNLPGEFAALQHAPEPWTPIDSVAVADFLLERFGTGGGDELGNARLLARLQGALPASEAEAAFSDAVWVVHPTSYATIPEGTFGGPVSLPKALADLAPEQREALEAAQRSEPFGEPVEGVLPPGGEASAFPAIDLSGVRFGSNALLVSPALSREGRALVGGGPQTGYFNPEVLYEVGLHGAGVDVAGVGVAGAPGVVLGRTANFAWTVTSGISDEIDTVALPAAGGRSYLWDGEVRELDCRDEVHAVVTPPALGPAPPRVVHQEVCQSHLGPVVAWTRAGDGTPEWFFTARKAHRGLELESAQKWLGIDSAKDLAGFQEAFDGFAFTFNFFYAGPEGVCHFHVGSQPVRNPALDPRFPTPAGSAWDWQGMLTGASMPRACNPAQGYFANWNNLPQRGWGGGDNRELWGSVHRVQRLDQEVREALAASPDGKLDLDGVKGVLRSAATHDSLAFGLEPELRAHAPPAAQADLGAWAAQDYPWRDADGDGFYDDLGHAWYDPVRADLQRRVLGDELGPFLRVWNPDPRTAGDPHAGDHGTHDNKDALLLDALRGATGRDWCDDVTTPEHETCAQHIEAAFAAAGSPGPLAVHTSRFSPIGAGPAYTMTMTNRATYYHFHDPVGDTALPQSRSGSAIPPGQSGHLTAAQLALVACCGDQGSQHMRDQLPLYVNFEFKPVPITMGQADAASGGEPQTLLVPPPNRPPHAAGEMDRTETDRLTPVKFTDRSTDSDGVVVEWLWDFGDGSTSGEQNPSHLYTRLGVFRVTLTVTDNDGASDTAEIGRVKVKNIPPKARMDHDSEANRIAPASFRDLSEDPDGSVVAWSWSFGDGGASSEPRPGHQYKALGTYPLLLTVTDSDGDRTSIAGGVAVVNLPPLVAFAHAPDVPMVLESVEFDDLTSDPDGGILDWAWGFGDGASAQGAKATHRYLQGGHYPVSLAVTDSDGAVASVTRELFVCAPGADVGTLLTPDHVRLEVESCVKVGAGLLPG